MIHGNTNLPAVRETAARVRSGEIKDLSTLNYADLVRVEPLVIEPIDPLRTQLESFVAAVQEHRKPEVTAEDGLAAVQAAERIVAAMEPQVVE